MPVTVTDLPCNISSGGYITGLLCDICGGEYSLPCQISGGGYIVVVIVMTCMLTSAMQHCFRQSDD